MSGSLCEALILFCGERYAISILRNDVYAADKDSYRSSCDSVNDNWYLPYARVKINHTYVDGHIGQKALVVDEQTIRRLVLSASYNFLDLEGLGTLHTRRE